MVALRSVSESGPAARVVATPATSRRSPLTPERADRLLGAASLAGLALVALAIALFPRVAPNAFILSVGVTVIGYAVYATSWNLVGGLIGYISLGHAAYSGMGAYATALLVTRAGWDPWVSMFIGALIVAVIAVPIGVASLRVRGASFVIVSIALVLILRLVGQSWSSLTGGSAGLRVPRPFPPDVLRPEQHERFFYLNGLLLAALVLLWWKIDRSRFGVGLRAIRDDEDKAESLGIPTFRYKLIVFVLSAGTTALAGGLYALWFGSLDPIFQFSIVAGANVVLMSLLGGVHTLIGPTIGAIVVGAGLEYIKTHYGDTQIHQLALGLLLVGIVLFLPDGVVPAVSGWIRRVGPRAASIRELSQQQLAAHDRGSDR